MLLALRALRGAFVPSSRFLGRPLEEQQCHPGQASAQSAPQATQKPNMAIGTQFLSRSLSMPILFTGLIIVVETTRPTVNPRYNDPLEPKFRNRYKAIIVIIRA